MMHSFFRTLTFVAILGSPHFTATAQDGFVASGQYSLSPEVKTIGSTGSIDYKRSSSGSSSNGIGGLINDAVGEIKNNVPGWGDPLVDAVGDLANKNLGVLEGEIGKWMENIGWGGSTPPFVPNPSDPSTGSSTGTASSPSTSQPDSGFGTNPYADADKIRYDLEQRSARALQAELNSPSLVVGASKDQERVRDFLK